LDNNAFAGKLERRSKERPISPWDERLPSRSPATASTEHCGWRSRTLELRRSDLERVIATFWSRGDQLVVTLQWTVLGEDGQWMPVNSAPTPGLLGEW